MENVQGRTVEVGKKKNRPAKAAPTKIGLADYLRF